MLPALFAAGMSLVDATDGVLMLGAYGWAYIKPIRKLYYNLNITLVSVLIAFAIGGVEVLSIIADRFSLHGGAWDLVANLDFEADRLRDHRHLRGELDDLDPHLPLEGLRPPADPAGRHRRGAVGRLTPRLGQVPHPLRHSGVAVTSSTP